jgi:Leucine-rich repeat (LRR) protein
MLSLISCELNSLENFPHLPQLIRLDLVNNELSGDDIKHIVVCKHVQTVMLSHNQITSADDLKPLVPLKELTQLDFYGNPVVNIAEYRKRVFTLLPRL